MFWLKYLNFNIWIALSRWKSFQENQSNDINLKHHTTTETWYLKNEVKRSLKPSSESPR
jgi:hypothetical protein